MKTSFLVALAGLLAVALLMPGCSRESEPAKDKEGGAEKVAESESHVKHGTNGEVVVTLDAAVQKVMGLETKALAAASLSPEMNAFGRVLDVSVLTALVAELAAAQASSVASQAELDRLKRLAASDNASERALQAAAATATRDQVQIESIRLRLVSGWGNAIAGLPEPPTFVRALSTRESALVELDTPAGEQLTREPTGARLFTLADETRPIDAKYLGPATTTDVQMQGRGFLFLVQPNPFHLAAGTAIAGRLTLPGEPLTGVALSRDSVVMFNGTAWVYLQRGEDSFARLEVKLGPPLAAGWLVREGLKPGDKVVVVGAQQLLSEELKSQVGE